MGDVKNLWMEKSAGLSGKKFPVSKVSYHPVVGAVKKTLIIK
jgi:hypothetical protein